LHTRFGLHAGGVIVGNLGSSVRLDYTVLGDTVNFSSRLEGLNKFYGTEILVSEVIKEKVDDLFEFRKIDLVKVKGKTEGILIYEPLGRKGEVQEYLLQFRDDYEKTLNLYQKGQFDQAMAIISTSNFLQAKNNQSVSLLSERIASYQETPPKDGWSGATEFKEK
jgi:adenylate cyclase